MLKINDSNFIRPSSVTRDKSEIEAATIVLDEYLIYYSIKAAGKSQ